MGRLPDMPVPGAGDKLIQALAAYAKQLGVGQVMVAFRDPDTKHVRVSASPTLLRETDFKIEMMQRLGLNGGEETPYDTEWGG